MRVAIPHMGKYSEAIIKELGDCLGWEIILPPTPSTMTVELGSKHMNELMCLPAKVTLGTMIEACEMGAEHLCSFDSCGSCRLKTYWILQDRAVKKLGYNATVHPVRLGLKSPHDIRAVDPAISIWKSWWAFYKVLRVVSELDRKLWVDISNKDRKSVV